MLLLTGAAAAVLRERWGVTATVLPHPHVVPPDWLRRPRPDHDGFLVGVHAKSLRANLDPLPVVRRSSTRATGSPGCACAWTRTRT